MSRAGRETDQGNDVPKTPSKNRVSLLAMYGSDQYDGYLDRLADAATGRGHGVKGRADLAELALNELGKAWGLEPPPRALALGANQYTTSARKRRLAEASRDAALSRAVLRARLSLREALPGERFDLWLSGPLAALGGQSPRQLLASGDVKAFRACVKAEKARHDADKAAASKARGRGRPRKADPDA